MIRRGTYLRAAQTLGCLEWCWQSGLAGNACTWEKNKKNRQGHRLKARAEISTTDSFWVVRLLSCHSSLDAGGRGTGRRRIKHTSGEIRSNRQEDEHSEAPDSWCRRGERRFLLWRLVDGDKLWRMQLEHQEMEISTVFLLWVLPRHIAWQKTNYSIERVERRPGYKMDFFTFLNKSYKNLMKSIKQKAGRDQITINVLCS